MKLVAQTVQTPRTTKIKIEKIRADGTQVTFFTGSFIVHTDYAACSKRLGVSEDVVSTIVDGMLRQGQNPCELYLTNKVAEKPKYRVRHETGSATRAWLFDDFASAIQKAGVDTGMVIEWEGKEWTCCLDLDFNDFKPTPEQLTSFCETIKPAPVYYWLSKSGGLHLIYASTEIYTADELASVAAYHLVQRFPNGEVEFLHRTRCPKHQPHTRIPDTDIAALRSLLLEVVETDCVAWLTERGYEIGCRYNHIDCPVSPSDRSRNNTPPVVVYNDHIFCYICQKDGRCCGSRRPGFFPIPALSGGRVNTQIANAVTNFVHWTHARHIMRSTINNEEHARLLYSSLLKLKHGDDMRIPMAFKSAEPNGLVRYNGYWCDSGGKTVELEKSSSILKQLPHCHDMLPNGDTQINPATCEWLSKPVDQSLRGYYAVTPIRGIHITQYQELPSNKIYNVLQTAKLSPDDMVKRRPEFVPSPIKPGERETKLEKAWQTLEYVFPHIDRRYIELLIVGRGCVEHRSGLPPMVFCTGPTGVGKTSHAQIAAAICGDNETTVQLKRERDRFLNGVLQAKNNGGFVLFDEFFKYAKQAGLDETESIEQLLSFTEESLIYLIHVGSVPLGDLPLFIWCDNEIPNAVLSHEQIGRRVIHHELTKELNWEISLRNAGINRADRLRTDGTTEMIAACNTILSTVIEEHFTTPSTDFIEVAKLLGFKLIRESSNVDDKHALIHELCTAIIKAKDIDAHTNEKKRFSPKGFKLCKSVGVDNLYQLIDLCQKPHEKGSTELSIVAESNLQNILNTKQSCKIELRKHGLQFAIRIVSHDGLLVNGELL